MGPRRVSAISRCYTRRVLLPFDRTALATRNARDAAEEVAATAAMTLQERLEETIALSDFVLALAEANGTAALIQPEPIADKANRLARPLRLAAERWKPSSETR